jgi:Tfp pilus assembly protein PilN
MPSLQKLEFDFGARYRKPSLTGIGLLIAGIGAGVFSALQLVSVYHTREAEQAVYDALVFRIHSTRNVDESDKNFTPAETEKLKKASLIANELNAPWDILLGVLESAPMEHVALLSVEPIAAGRQLRLVGEAKNLSAMLTYLSYLQSKPELQRVMLTSHQIQNQPGSPVRFHIQAHWGDQE